jgi:hypothetical protein
MPAQVNIAPTHPQPVAVPVPTAMAAGVRAQTAKAIKHAGEAARTGRSRSGRDTDAAIDEDANALGAKSQRRSGNHTFDVEA